MHANANVADHKLDGEGTNMKNFPSKLTGNLENVYFALVLGERAPLFCLWYMLWCLLRFLCPINSCGLARYHIFVYLQRETHNSRVFMHKVKEERRLEQCEVNFMGLGQNLFPFIETLCEMKEDWTKYYKSHNICFPSFGLGFLY